jgi:TPP-dependent trihydroxycyclohexane-1,2-dione (THcHDO) dehydratase
MSDAIAMDWVATCKGSGSDAVRRQVEEFQAADLAKLSTRRRGKLLVLDVGARITSANQKWMEVPVDEDDGMELGAALVKARADFCVR